MSSIKIINEANVNEWIEKCPIKIIKYQIVENIESKKRYLRIKFKNLLQEKIKSVYLKVECFDDCGDELGFLEDSNLLSMNVNQLEEFGVDQLIELSDRKIYKVRISIEKIMYGAEKNWKNDSIEPVEMKYEKLSLSDELITQLERELKSYEGDVKCLPNEKRHYWQCCCAQYNDLDKSYCGNCGVDKNWIFEKFNVEYLKQQLLKQEEKEKIQEEEEKFQREEKEYREKKKKKIRKISIGIIGGILILCLSIVYITRYINDRNYIAQYFETTKGRNYGSVKSLIKHYSSGSLALYLKNNELSIEDYNELINSGKEQLYKDFYTIEKVELMEKLNITEKYEGIINTAYFKYLYENSNYIPSSVAYNNILTELFVSGKYDEWKEVVCYLSKYDFGWNDAGRYFDTGYGYELGNDYDAMKNKAKTNTEYSAYYHKNSGDYTFFYCDLFNKEIMELIFKNSPKGGLAGGYVLSSNLGDISYTVVQDYKDAGGDLLYSSYIGTMIDNLIFHNYPSLYETSSPTEFENKLKIFVEAGVDINHIQDAEQANTGYNTLDIFLDKLHPNKENYNSLKKYGAVAYKRASKERDLK